MNNMRVTPQQASVPFVRKLNNKLSPFVVLTSILAMIFKFAINHPIFGSVTLKEICQNASEISKHSGSSAEVFEKICAALFALVIINGMIHVVDSFKKMTLFKVLCDVAVVVSLLCMTLNYSASAAVFAEKAHYGLGYLLIWISVVASFVSLKIGRRSEFHYYGGTNEKWICPRCNRKNKDGVCPVCGTEMDKRYSV